MAADNQHHPYIIELNVGTVKLLSSRITRFNFNFRVFGLILHTYVKIVEGYLIPIQINNATRLTSAVCTDKHLFHHLQYRDIC